MIILHVAGVLIFGFLGLLQTFRYLKIRKMARAYPSEDRSRQTRKARILMIIFYSGASVMAVFYALYHLVLTGA